MGNESLAKPSLPADIAMDDAQRARFLESILESSTEYTMVAENLDGLILLWNAGASAMYGYTADEVVGKVNDAVLYDPAELSCGRPASVKEQVLRLGRWSGELGRIRKDGRRFIAFVTIKLRLGEDGEPVGFTVISHDVAEEQKLNRRLKDSEEYSRGLIEQLRCKNLELEAQNRRVEAGSRLKSEFLANMSHELRTPLNGIIGFSELMVDGKVGAVSDDHKEYLNDILTSARHLLRLINDVLDLAKVESGKMDFRPEPVDLAKIVGEVSDILRTLAAKKHIRIDAEVASDARELVLDAAKLKQVLYNYLSNALKFTPEGGRVSVRAKSDPGGQVRISVEDTGVGIRSEDISRLFVEFQQLDSTTSKKYQGTGLGLALTKKIVEAQGGRVGVESVPGEGSTFFATLPRVPLEGPEPVADEVRPPARPGAPKLLVIEDDASERMWLARTLDGAGYSVETAGSVAEAVSMAKRRVYDGITLDLLLPDGNGWDVLREIRAGGASASSPVIVVTVVSDQTVTAGLGVSEVLTKPVLEDELVAALKRSGVDSGGHRTVLIVEDDEDTCRLTLPALAAHGYKAVCVPDGESGLRAFAAEKPAAVVLDLMLTGMDGFEFLHRLRRMDVMGRTPVIVWTAGVLDREQLDRLATHAEAILVKREGALADLLSELAHYVPLDRGEEETHAIRPDTHR